MTPEQHKHRENGLKALALAQKIPRKIVFIPRGITGDILGQNKSLSRGRNNSNKLDHSEVLKMLNEGVKQSVVAKHFKVSSQAISYIKFKNKEDKKDGN
jgi:hypothetical protein